jgi:hypothetical protein
MNVLFHMRRHQRRTGSAGYATATRSGWSLRNLMSRVTSRIGPDSMKSPTDPSHLNTAGERDGVKLIDITQCAVVVERKNTSMDGSSNPSPALSAHSNRV